METIYEVVVGNLGCVYYGPRNLHARQHFNHYVKLSKKEQGRAAGEQVTLLQDGEILKEYIPAAAAAATATKPVPFKHTPGPWSRNIKPVSRYPVIFAGRNEHVAMVLNRGQSMDELEANCDLIKAAPELLDALVELRAAVLESIPVDQWDENLVQRMEQAERAVWRATGVSA